MRVLWLAARARLLHKLGRWNDAWRDYTRALRREPDFRVLLHDRACLLADKGDFGGARRELDRILARHPDMLICMREKALLCHRVGDAEGAPKLDMSPKGIGSRLREASNLLALCNRLALRE